MKKHREMLESKEPDSNTFWNQNSVNSFRNPNSVNTPSSLGKLLAIHHNSQYVNSPKFTPLINQ